MVTFKAKQEDIEKWFPKTREIFISELKNSQSSSRKHPVSKIEWFITWGFMTKKPKTDEEKVLKQLAYDEKLRLVYDERVKVEIPRIKIDVAMKAGHYFKCDRIVIEETPDFVKEMASEIVKSMMYAEQKELNDPVVLASMESFIDKFKDKDEKKSRGVIEPSFDLDSILDKINDLGMSSLTASELQFLEKKSKG